MDIGYGKYQQPKNLLQKYIGSHNELLNWRSIAEKKIQYIHINK